MEIVPVTSRIDGNQILIWLPANKYVVEEIVSGGLGSSSVGLVRVKLLQTAPPCSKLKVERGIYGLSRNCLISQCAGHRLNKYPYRKPWKIQRWGFCLLHQEGSENSRRTLCQPVATRCSLVLRIVPLIIGGSVNSVTMKGLLDTWCGGSLVSVNIFSRFGLIGTC